MDYRLSVIINKDQNGFYASCPDLPGCHTQGDTLDETLTNIKEAAELYLETMSPDEISQALDNEILTTTVQVKVA